MRWNCCSSAAAIRCPRHDDADPRSLGRQPADGCETACLLRISRGLMEPWDGPAALPSPTAARSAPRWTATACALPLPGHRRRLRDHGVRNGRAGVRGKEHHPQVAPAARQDAADRLEEGRIVSDEDLKEELATKYPYREWLDRTQLCWRTCRCKAGSTEDQDVSLLDRQQAFGYTQEDTKFLMAPMARPARKPSARWAPTRRLGAVVGQAEAAAHLFQAELRPGHQPADRPDPRRAGHEPGVVHRPAPQPARS
jgi:hypothetical protein